MLAKNKLDLQGSPTLETVDAFHEATERRVPQKLKAFWK